MATYRLDRISEEIKKDIMGMKAFSFAKGKVKVGKQADYDKAAAKYLPEGYEKLAFVAIAKTTDGTNYTDKYEFIPAKAHSRIDVYAYDEDGIPDIYAGAMEYIIPRKPAVRMADTTHTGFFIIVFRRILQILMIFFKSAQLPSFVI